MYILPNGEIKKAKWDNGKKGAYIEMDHKEKEKYLKLKEAAEQAAADIDYKFRQLLAQVEQRQQIQENQQIQYEEDRLPEEGAVQEYMEQLKEDVLIEDQKQREQHQALVEQKTMVKQSTSNQYERPVAAEDNEE